MPSVLVISSYVAASNVGGGIAPRVLGAMGVDCVLAPTTLLGRHPGHGAPGGGAVEVETLEGVLEGVAAQGRFGAFDAVLVGYFADPAQVGVAARAIDAVRAARPATRPPFVLVDPIMGDVAEGLFIAAETAAAIAGELIPRADLVACNHWEFQRLVGPAATLEDVVEAARATESDWLVGSIPFRGRLANALVSAERSYVAAGDVVPPPNPKGTGDLFRLIYLGQLLSGVSEADALHRAIGVVETGLQTARIRKESDLDLTTLSHFLSDPPSSGSVVPVDEND